MAAAGDEQRSMIEFLRRLVIAESPTSVPDSQAGILMILLETLEDIGLNAKLYPGKEFGGHLIAEVPNENKNRSQQMLIGHCDTVWPIGTIKSMPFTHEGNVIKGPGAYDMKGGLTQLIFALKIIHRLGLEMPIRPLVFINSDEESGSIESRAHIDNLAKQVERVFVLEPSLGLEGKLKTARKGVGRFSLLVTGKAAHAGLEPEKGVSAILELSYLIQKFHALNDPTKGITVNVGKIEGGLSSNVIPPTSRAEIDVRVPSWGDADRIETQILNLRPQLKGTRISIQGGINRPPLERTVKNNELWIMARQIGQNLGLDLLSGTAGGGSDGNFTSQYTATLDGLGAVGDGAHAQHEFIFIDKMIERTALMTLLILAP
jgi:glutamate carboxypeptidase